MEHNKTTDSSIPFYVIGCFVFKDKNEIHSLAQPVTGSTKVLDREITVYESSVFIYFSFPHLSVVHFLFSLSVKGSKKKKSSQLNSVLQCEKQPFSHISLFAG